ncbi:MAG: hypothetical protein IJ227_01380 [Mogibacterium sp.]|nr:hypothetical protein [Mogibacterium sp.]
MRNPNRTAGKRRAENEENIRPDTLVICAGKYGSSEQYTRWLMDRLGSDAMPFNKQQLGYASLYRSIVWIGAIKDAEIIGINLLWQNHHNFGLEGKKIIVCGVGLGDPANEAYVEKVRKRSGSADDQFCSFYLLPGRIDRKKLKLLDGPQFDKFLVDAARIYGEETAALINERAAENYNGIDASALDPVVQEILATRN